MLPDERARTVVGVPASGPGVVSPAGIEAQRVLSDDGNAYRSHIFAVTCRTHSLAQRFTCPYTPRTNGKAERFIQTLLRE